MAPETVGPAPVGEIPPLIIVRPPEVPETPETTPETTKPPPPVIVNPPEGGERETEEATRRKDRPPKPNEVFVYDRKWRAHEPNAPRYLPCSYAGLGGSGAFRPEQAPSDWIRCSYRCGRYQVNLYDIRRPKPDARSDKTPGDEATKAICEKALKRAEDHARRYDDALEARRD
jgi:hypothetical protein